MALTAQQQATLKAAINANPTWAAFPVNSDGAFDLAKLLNAQASPNFTVWKTNVSLTEVGNNIDGAELSALTTADSSRMQVIADYSEDGINPSLIDRRAFFDDIFSGAGGTVTRPKLAALWKRLATEAERILSTGTGSNAVPATMSFEGSLSYQDVLAARTSA